MTFDLKKLGPGLLFAGAAIGVSHLVQSTRAGADFGFGLIWALLLVNLAKYPFFQFGPRFASATGMSLLDGYRKMGKGVLIAYFILTFATMFTIQTAVTIVTAGLASSLFGDFISVETWTIIILAICSVLLMLGRYKLLDNLIKVIIIVLSISTILAVVMAIGKNEGSIIWTQVLPENSVEIAFLIAFMGWMPAPLDISVWHSLWTVEKKKEISEFSPKSALFDFNVGYIGTVILGIGFVLLGTLIMFNSGESFSGTAGIFANQLIQMYTSSLGDWAYIIIGIAAFTTMFSTTLTTLDASPRAMHRTLELLSDRKSEYGFYIWLAILALGTIAIFFFFASEMGLLVKIATILSFITAPFYAILNYRLICSSLTPKRWRPSTGLHLLSWAGIAFLIGFSIWFLTTL
ncbi:MAG: Nramp family divalent metal transporter [Bacteroidia bacterium]|nr:Nramp family divalent metal transporter [Bacteroidia bacterium]NNF82709.1 Nramp family divalent metal transporter [Flavobacteriaceae bacterium]NNK71325.1 Nramp family divalent metal transporter [Flavobacteriaceae bacterium]NNL79279.1 Nramp family divalent metal transporter [Flavobacteriaceae bacterium]